MVRLKNKAHAFIKASCVENADSVLLAAALLILCACDSINPIQTGFIADTPRDLRLQQEIDYDRRYIEGCEKNNRAISNDKPCRPEIVECVRMKVDAFSSMSGSMSKKYEASYKPYMACLNKVWANETDGGTQ